MSSTDFERASSFSSLIAAALRAARGKRRRPDAALFLSDLERESLQLERELRDGSYRPGPYRTFEIYEPKRRVISAAPFRDRVVHHAICAVLEPSLERSAEPASFASRRGLGPLASVERVRSLARQHRYVLRLDVRRFFFSVDHEVLLAALAKKIEDPRLVALVRLIVWAGAQGAVPGKGLPIGNLTSQHFANFYLGPLDRFIRRTLRLGHARYTDDLACFADAKPELWIARDAIAAFLARSLKLALKDEATRVLPSSEGVPWLGLRVWPRQVRLDAAHLRHLACALRRLERRVDLGLDSENALALEAAGVLGWAEHGGTRAWCRAYFARRAEDRGCARREVEDER